MRVRLFKITASLLVPCLLVDSVSAISFRAALNPKIAIQESLFSSCALASMAEGFPKTRLGVEPGSDRVTLSSLAPHPRLSPFFPQSNPAGFRQLQRMVQRFLPRRGGAATIGQNITHAEVRAVIQKFYANHDVATSVYSQGNLAMDEDQGFRFDESTLGRAVKLADAYRNKHENHLPNYMWFVLFDFLGARTQPNLTSKNLYDYALFHEANKFLFGHGGRGKFKNDPHAYVSYPLVVRLFSIYEQAVKLGDIPRAEMTERTLSRYLLHEARHAWEKLNGDYEWENKKEADEILSDATALLAAPQPIAQFAEEGARMARALADGKVPQELPHQLGHLPPRTNFHFDSMVIDQSGRYFYLYGHGTFLRGLNIFYGFLVDSQGQKHQEGVSDVVIAWQVPFISPTPLDKYLTDHGLRKIGAEELAALSTQAIKGGTDAGINSEKKPLEEKELRALADRLNRQTGGDFQFTFGPVQQADGMHDGIHIRGSLARGAIPVSHISTIEIYQSNEGYPFVYLECTDGRTPYIIYRSGEIVRVYPATRETEAAFDALQTQLITTQSNHLAFGWNNGGYIEIRDASPSQNRAMELVTTTHGKKFYAVQYGLEFSITEREAILDAINLKGFAFSNPEAAKLRAPIGAESSQPASSPEQTTIPTGDENIGGNFVAGGPNGLTNVPPEQRLNPTIDESTRRPRYAIKGKGKSLTDQKDVEVWTIVPDQQAKQTAAQNPEDMRVARPSEYLRQSAKDAMNRRGDPPLVLPFDFGDSSTKLRRDVRKIGELEKNVPDFDAMVSAVIRTLEAKGLARDADENDILELFQVIKGVFDLTGLTIDQFVRMREMSEGEHRKIVLALEHEEGEFKGKGPGSYLIAHKAILDKFIPKLRSPAGPHLIMSADGTPGMFVRGHGLYGEQAQLASYFRAFQLLASVVFSLDERSGGREFQEQQIVRGIKLMQILHTTSVRDPLSDGRNAGKMVTALELLHREEQYLSDVGRPNYETSFSRLLFITSDGGTVILLKQAMNFYGPALARFVHDHFSELESSLKSKPYVGQSSKATQQIGEPALPDGFVILTRSAASDQEVIQSRGDELANRAGTKADFYNFAAARYEWVIQVFLRLVGVTTGDPHADGMTKDLDPAQLAADDLYFASIGKFINFARQHYSTRAFRFYSQQAITSFIVKAEEVIKGRERAMTIRTRGGGGFHQAPTPSFPTAYVPATPTLYEDFANSAKAQYDPLYEYFHDIPYGPAWEKFHEKMDELREIQIIYRQLADYTRDYLRKNNLNEESLERPIPIYDKELNALVFEKWAIQGKIKNAKPVAVPLHTVSADLQAGQQWHAVVNAVVGPAIAGSVDTAVPSQKARFAMYSLWRIFTENGGEITTNDVTVTVNNPDNADLLTTPDGLLKAFAKQNATHAEIVDWVTHPETINAASEAKPSAMVTSWVPMHNLFAKFGLGWLIRGLAAVRESFLLTTGAWTIEQFVAKHTHYNEATLRKIEEFALSTQHLPFWAHAWEHILFNIPFLSHVRDTIRNQQLLFTVSA